MAPTMWNNDMIIGQGLGAMFEETSSQPAAMLGLFNTPDFLLPVEMASIKLGRAAKLRSYNDYRELLQYPRVTSFDQISSDERVRKELERLYGHVDNVELYVGLYAEDGAQELGPAADGRAAGGASTPSPRPSPTPCCPSTSSTRRRSRPSGGTRS